MSIKPPYANETTKRIALSLSGVVAIADALIEDGRFRGSDEAIEHVKKMKDDAQMALNAVMDGLDADQAYGIIRYGKLCEFTLVPKSSPICEKGFFIVSPDDISAMLRDPLSRCNFCDLKGKDAKKCEIRRMLLRTGAVELDESDKLYGACPYRI